MKKKKCPFCDKVLEGYKRSHVEYLLRQHILSKHKDKMKFKTANQLE